MPKKKVEEKTPASTMKDAMAIINKKYGDGSSVRLGSAKHVNVDVIPTGNVAIDKASGVGGLPKGRIIEVFGPESCIGGDTHLNYAVRRKDGTRANNKGGSVRRLWDRFHGIYSGKGGYKRPGSDDYWYSIASAKEDGVLTHNRINDVVKTGEKMCYEVKTKTATLICTADHKLFTDTTYTALSDLRVGDEVGVHDKTGNGRGKYVSRTDIFTAPNHPIAPTKVVRVNGSSYTYSRIRKSRAVLEAHQSGLTLDQYKKQLDAGDLNGINFLPTNTHVHHINEDAADDRIENLAVITPSDHGKLHAKDGKMRYTVSMEKIESIVEVGVRETFDLKMSDPYRNYVAGNFITHNCGKTTFCLAVAAQAQRSGGQVCFIDVEHSLDPRWAGVNGVSVKDLIFSQPDCGEDALNMVEDYVRGGAAVVVLDSVAALVAKSELDGDMGDASVGVQARMMSQAMRKLTSIVSHSNCLVIFTNQIRMKIGVMFGNPETTPGGRALPFFASMRLDVRRIGKIKGSGDSIVGSRTRIKFVKNKVAAPFTECEFDIMYNEGISSLGSLVDLATSEGIIEKKGSWFSFEGAMLGQGKDSTKKALLDDAVLRKKIEDLVAQKVTVEVGRTLGGQEVESAIE